MVATILFRVSFTSFSLLPKNLEIKMYKTLILLVVLYTVSEGHGPRTTGNKVLRRMFGPERRKCKET